jgi:hypothetical protein
MISHKNWPIRPVFWLFVFGGDKDVAGDEE